MGDKDDYNPYDYREGAHPMTDFGAFLNLIKAILGTGVLASPMAFRNAGYLPAIIGTIIIGGLIIYSKMILLSGMYELEKRKRVPLMTYSEAMVTAVTEGPNSLRCLKNLLSYVVSGMLIINHFGACCVYVVFIANCMKDFGDYYWTVIDNRYYMLMEIVPLCLIFYITNLNALVPYVFVANLSLILGFAILFYYIMTDMQPFSEMITFQDVYYYPFFFGATMFAFDAPGLVVAIEANMKNPAHFRNICGVYVQAMIIIITFQIAFAFFGYWSYGEQVASTILQNLPSNAVLSALARIIFAISLYISHPLQGYVPVDVLWNNWLKAKVPENRQLAWELVVRTIIALLTDIKPLLVLIVLSTHRSGTFR
ncbi:proton-coupled amino acid transporter-like protein CG1139 isoform X2 [Eurosta solidaginis]|uniref:proton-coupled amino acid transporter-like protein CG1139 isoform X2 n=1 Tax=Eurosta solidaginis TaxID=178769 RepID=UPI003530DEB1